MLKVGLVGVGGISGAHIPAWDKMDTAELVAICDIRPERLELYPEKRHYADFDEMLANEKLDILDICLPTYLHADYAVKALEKGINVISEKPISLKTEDVSRIYTAAKNNNVKFMVAQVLRFWPEYELVDKINRSGEFGKLLSGHMSRLTEIPHWSWDNWMFEEDRSGLVPFDLHIHDLDFLVYSLGKPTAAYPYRCKRTEQDSILMIYEFGDAFISVESAWYNAPYPFGAGFRFQFEKALIEYADGKLKIYKDDGNIIDFSDKALGDTGSINLPKSDAYANEIEYFADCVLNDKPVEKVKPEELEEVLRLLHKLSK